MYDEGMICPGRSPPEQRRAPVHPGRYACLDGTVRPGIGWAGPEGAADVVVTRAHTPGQLYSLCHSDIDRTSL